MSTPTTTMTTQHDDGGPAFPIPYGQVMSEEGKGMSLRDWFAGQALAGQLASMSSAAAVAAIRQEDAPRWCAQSAYVFADAMIAARGRGERRAIWEQALSRTAALNPSAPRHSSEHSTSGPPRKRTSP